MKMTIQAVQAEERRLLSALDSFCRENELRYFMAYGTLLGSVRHSGFIPWDDDADVYMPRPDYEKLLEIGFDGEGCRLVRPAEEDATTPYAKIMSTTTVFREAFAKKHPNSGIFIDLFPLDGVPEDDRSRESLYKKGQDSLQDALLRICPRLSRSSQPNFLWIRKKISWGVLQNCGQG